MSLYGLVLQLRAHGLGFRPRVSLKDTLLCLVGGHLDIICVCLWFLILPHTELGEKVSKTVTVIVSVVDRLSLFNATGFPRIPLMFLPGVAVTPSLCISPVFIWV